MKERPVTVSGPPQEGSFRFAEISRSLSFSAGVLFIPVIALVVLVILILLLSDSPARTFYFFFIGPFRNVYSFGNMLNAAIPLVLGALGITVAMKSGSLNLGGEGQIYLGAFVAAAIACSFSGNGIAQFGVIAGIFAAAAGVLCAGVVAAFSGFCKARWNTSELITTFLFSSAIIPIVNYLVTGPFMDPQTSLLSTRKIPENMRLPQLPGHPVLNTGIFIAIALVIIVHFFLERTKTGYEFRMAGYNELFARYGGINTKLNTVLAMAISGGFYGLAGSVAVMGTYHSVIKEFSAGLGWNGLAVALIACFNTAAVIPAALFFAWIGSGARIAMQNTGLTIETASIVQSVIFFLSTSLVIRGIFTRRGGIK